MIEKEPYWAKEQVMPGAILVIVWIVMGNVSEPNVVVHLHPTMETCRTEAAQMLPLDDNVRFVKCYPAP